MPHAKRGPNAQDKRIFKEMFVCGFLHSRGIPEKDETVVLFADCLERWDEGHPRRLASLVGKNIKKSAKGKSHGKG